MENQFMCICLRRARFLVRPECLLSRINKFGANFALGYIARAERVGAKSESVCRAAEEERKKSESKLMKWNR